MSELIMKLRESGCDVDAALERFMKKEELYVKFIRKFKQDPSFVDYMENVAAADYAAALQSVHSLKGVSGNLGFSLLFEIASDMVADFRAGETDKALSRNDELEKAYNDIVAIIDSVAE